MDGGENVILRDTTTEISNHIKSVETCPTVCSPPDDPFLERRAIISRYPPRHVDHPGRARRIGRVPA
jgi:hypothetical protein